MLPGALTFLDLTILLTSGYNVGKRLRGLLTGGCECAGWFFTKHQEPKGKGGAAGGCGAVVVVCVYCGSRKVQRCRGTTKKLSVFGLFFSVQLTARAPSNRQTRKQLGTCIESKTAVEENAMRCNTGELNIFPEQEHRTTLDYQIHGPIQ